jgi:predicted TIM-barrel fold metal-dependent hydrolase
MTDKRRWSYRGCACCDGSTLSLSGAALSRRHFVAGAAATAAIGLSKGAAAQTAETTKPYRIDVHHHLSPPTYIAAANANNFGEIPMKNWTPEKTLADMDRAGVAVAMLSVTTPALNFTSGDASSKLARECNEYAAQLLADHPGRFGSFATVPLTDIDGSLQEIAYALDTLKADGICLMTSYGDKWLGDPLFLPVMLLDPNAKPTVPGGTLAELRRFYYDTAQTSNKGSMSALAAIIPVSQIVFGTDFPYRTGIDHVKGLRDAGVFSDAQLMDIERGNALKLLPRLVG